VRTRQTKVNQKEALNIFLMANEGFFRIVNQKDSQQQDFASF